MSLILFTVSIVSTLIFCYYTALLASSKEDNSEYVGLLLLGVSAGLMICIVHYEAHSSTATMISSVITGIFLIQSKIYHKQLKAERINGVYNQVQVN